MKRRDPILRRAETEALRHMVSSIRLRVRKPYRLHGDCRCTVTRLALPKQRPMLTNIETRPLPSKRKNRYYSDQELRTLWNSNPFLASVRTMKELSARGTRVSSDP